MEKEIILKLKEFLDEELQSDKIIVVPKTIYKIVTTYLRNSNNFVKKHNDKIIEEIRYKEKEVIIELITRILEIRIEKSRKDIVDEYSFNLLSEEKYILEAYENVKQRKNKVIDAIKNGQTSILLNITELKKNTLVKFLKSLEVTMGVDLKEYGPYFPEDIAILPTENVIPLIKQGIVSKIEFD